MNVIKRSISLFLAVITILNMCSVIFVRTEAIQAESPPAPATTETSETDKSIITPGETVEPDIRSSGKKSDAASPQVNLPNETYPTILGFASSSYDVYKGSSTTIAFTCETTGTLDDYSLRCSDPGAVSYGVLQEKVSSSVSGPKIYTVSTEITALSTGEYTMMADVVLSGQTHTISVPLRISSRPEAHFTRSSYTADIGENVAMTFTYNSEEAWDSISWSCDNPAACSFSEGTSSVPPGEGGTGEENTWWFSNSVTALRGGSYTITAEITSGGKTYTISTRLHVNDTIYSGVLKHPNESLEPGDVIYIDSYAHEIAEGCELSEVYQSSEKYQVTDVLYTLDADDKVVTLYPVDLVIKPEFTVSGRPVSFSYENGQWNAEQLTVSVTMKWVCLKGCPYTLSSLQDSHVSVPVSSVVLTTDSDAIHFGLEGTFFKKELREYTNSNVSVQIGFNTTYTFPVYMSEDYTLDTVSEFAAIDTTVTTSWDKEYRGNSLQISFSNLELQKQEAQKKQEAKQQSAVVKQLKKELDSLEIGLSGPLVSVLSQAQYSELEGFLSFYLVESIMANQLLDSSFIDTLTVAANKKIGEAVLEKLNITKVENWFSIQNNEGTVQVECTTKYGERIVITFELDWQSYHWGEGDPFAGTVNIHYSVEGTLPSGMSTTGQGFLAFSDLEQFGDAMLDYVEEAYDEAWGEDANKVASLLIGEPVYQLLGGDFSGGIYRMLKGASQYHTKINRVKCPVDVYIYDSDGALCGSIVDNYVDIQDSVVYAYVNGNEKIIHLLDDSYYLELIGNGDGTMDYSVEEYVDGELIRKLSTTDVFLMDGKTYQAIIPDSPRLHRDTFALTEDDGDVIELTDSLSIQDPTPTSAPRVYETGACGENATYTLYTNGVVVISGTGPIADDPIDYSVRSMGRYLLVEEGITRIGAEAFRYNNFVYVELADSVTEIGKWGFGNGSSLSSIKLGSGMQSFDTYAFSFCDELNTIAVSEDSPYLKTVDGVLFSKDGSTLYLMPKSAPASAPTSYAVPEGVTTIGVDAFGDNSYLTQITLPTTLTTLGSEAFSYCTKLEQLVVNGSITSIGASLFDSTKTVKKVTIGPAVSQILPNLFYGIRGCEVVVDGDNPYLFADSSYVLYSKDPAQLLFTTCNLAGAYQVAGQTRIIPDSALKDQVELTSVTLPDSLVSIGEYAFDGCTALTHVSFGQGLQTIGSYAFQDCTSLPEVLLPDSVTSAGYRAFSGCTALTHVVFPESISIYRCVPADNFTSAGPHGSGCDLEFGWTTSLPDNALTGFTKLTKVILPQELTSIGSYAFSNCTGLTAMVLPDGLISIGNNAFKGCSALSSIRIPQSVTSLGTMVFTNTALTSAGPLGSSCDMEFGWQEQLPKYAFRGIGSLTSILLPDGLTAIPDYAFYGCSALESLSIPQGVTSIGSYAFNSCTNLHRLVIPASVTSVANSAMNNSSLLSAGPIGSGCEVEYGWTDAIPAYAFQNMTALESLILPGELIQICDSAFYGCSALSSVVFHPKLEQIDRYAFGSCTALNSIYFEGSPPAISDYAFSDVTATARYPIGAADFWADRMKNYGGTLTWESYDSPMHLVQEPEDVYGYIGKSVTFTTVVTAGNCTFQWYESPDGETWQLCPDESNGATSFTFTATLDRMGHYFRCRITDSEGNSVLTKAAQLIDQSVTLELNERTELNVESTIWYKSFTIIPDKSGDYLFEFDFTDTCRGYLYDAQGSLICDWDSDRAYYEGKYLVCQLEAGEVYTLYTWFSDTVYLTMTRNDPIPLTLNTRTEAIIPTGLSARYYTIVPDQTAEYILRFEEADYITCILTAPDGTIINKSTGSYVRSFDFVCELTAGVEYTLHLTCAAIRYDDPFYITLLNGHNYTVRVLRTPSCEVRGREVHTCIDCGYTTTKYPEPTGHSYVNGVCVNCSSGIISSGFCGETVSWELTSDGLLHIYGTGEMDNYTYDEGLWSESPWYPLQDQISSVELDNGVSSIGNSSFYCLNIQSMEIPASIAKIGYSAWWGSSISEIRFWGDAPEFKYSVFRDCALVVYYDAANTTWTKDIMLNYEGDVDWIPFEHQDSNSWGDNLTWSYSEETSTLTFSGEGEMADCRPYYGTPDPWDDLPFTKVVFESGITSIADFAFDGISSLTEVILPDTVTQIGRSAFSDCTVLKEVHIPDGSSVSSKAFCNCTALKDIWFGKYQYSYLAADAFTGVTAYAHYPEYSAYWPYPSEVGGNLTWVPYEVTPIIGRCGNDLLWSLENGVLSIFGTGEMYDYDSLYSEESDARISPWIDYSALIHSIGMEKGIISIGSYAFQGLEYADDVTIPSTVKTIGSHSLYGLNITVLNIPEGVVSIGEWAFGNCHELTEVHFPSTLRSVGNAAFYQDDNVEQVHIPNLESWFRIQFTSFFSTPFSNYYDTLLYVKGVPVTNIIVPTSVTEIGTAQFDNYSAMTGIQLHDRVTKIGDDAFNADGGADPITQVIVPESVASIGSRAFANLSHLSDAFIMNPDCEFGEDVFLDSNCYFDETLDRKVYGTTTIHGHSGSTAEDYAAEFYHPFVELTPFTDVVAGSFYYDAVLWAVENGVTSGTSIYTFSPLAVCNRAQVVTFLWRANGCPEPAATSHSFTDVVEGSFYEKAVLWAVENGITTGIDATHFGPLASCNRAAVVTFLWRAEGRPTPQTTERSFTDVVAGSFYEDAVLWAVENGITNGLSSTSFGPTADCNRGQVVTFLYRACAD